MFNSIFINLFPAPRGSVPAQDGHRNRRPRPTNEHAVFHGEPPIQQPDARDLREAIARAGLSQQEDVRGPHGEEETRCE